MTKSDLITKLAMLPDADPRLREVEAVLNGAARATQDEPWLSLKEIAEVTRKHPVWLTKLHVQAACGERLAGRYSYRPSKVLDYLKSSRCLARVAELRDEKRRARLERKPEAEAVAA